MRCTPAQSLPTNATGCACIGERVFVLVAWEQCPVEQLRNSKAIAAIRTQLCTCANVHIVHCRLRHTIALVARHQGSKEIIGLMGVPSCPFPSHRNRAHKHASSLPKEDCDAVTAQNTQAYSAEGDGGGDCPVPQRDDWI